MTRALITGAAGFMGHHLVAEILARTDWKVTIIDRLDCSGNLNRLAEIGAAKNPRVTFVYHDLRAPINDQLCAQIGVHDYILHLAAATHVDRSIEDPMSFVLDNVVGTCNILEFARKVGCKMFLQFSTDEVFGSAPRGVEYAEDSAYNSGNPYAATKAGAEELAVSYANTYGVPVCISHTMNCVGERQHPEKFVPLTIARALDGRLIQIHADKTKTRPGSRFYIHALDVADAVLTLITANARGKYNIVGERELDNLTLAKMIAESVGARLNYELVDFHSSRPGHDLRYALSGEKMFGQFGWKPRIGIETRIANIVHWTLRNPHWLATLAVRAQSAAEAA